MSGNIRQQEAADSPRGAARSVVDIAAGLSLTVGLAVDPRVEAAEFHAGRRELAATPDFHALHVLCSMLGRRLAAHQCIISGICLTSEVSARPRSPQVVRYAPVGVAAHSPAGSIRPAVRRE